MMRPSVTAPRFALYLLIVASAGTQVGAAGELGRGLRWVRRNPLTTMALTIIPKSSNPQQYRDANLTTVLAWKQRPALLQGSARVGLPWHLHVRSVLLRENGLTDALMARLKNHHDTYQGCTGWIV